jgi:hypothetical protein
LKSSEASGIKILLIGTALLMVTFIIAGINLLGDIKLLPVPDFTETLGKAFSPLIEAAIQILYLGIMGWTASKITKKGLTEILQSRHSEKTNADA